MMITQKYHLYVFFLSQNIELSEENKTNFTCAAARVRLPSLGSGGDSGAKFLEWGAPKVEILRLN